MSSFVDYIGKQPTAMGFFDSNSVFQFEADGCVRLAKRMLGDDVVSVELSNRQMYTCLEAAFLEYGRLVGQYQIQSQIGSLLGMPNAFSGSIVSGTLSSSFSVTGLYPQTSFDFIMRQADAYAAYSGLGGVYNNDLVYFDLVEGKQEYNLYTELKDVSGSLYYQNLPSGSQGAKIRVFDVFHFEPLASQSYLLNASNVTNFLATEFNYESYVNSTVFYVLPVYEDILRRSMLETAARVRRSNYSYRIQGQGLTIFPTPVGLQRYGNRLYLRVATAFNNYSSINPATTDENYLVPGESITARTGAQGTGTLVGTPSAVPLTILSPTGINEVGRQWIRQYYLALCKMLLGRIRRKFKSIPIPGSEVVLDGDEMFADGQAEAEKLKAEIAEFLSSITYDQIIEKEAGKAEALNRFLKLQPMPMGKAISIR